MKVLAAILFGGLVAAMVTAMRFAPTDTSSIIVPAIVVAGFASAFMVVLLDIVKPSK